MYISVAQLLYEIWLKTKCPTFWIFIILLKKFHHFFSKNAKFEKLIFSHFLQYLLNYLTYRDVQYLILILRRFYFDLVKYNLSLGVKVLKLQSCKVVHFFLYALYSTTHFTAICYWPLLMVVKKRSWGDQFLFPR